MRFLGWIKAVPGFTLPKVEIKVLKIVMTNKGKLRICKDIPNYNHYILKPFKTISCVAAYFFRVGFLRGMKIILQYNGGSSRFFSFSLRGVEVKN